MKLKIYFQSMIFLFVIQGCFSDLSFTKCNWSFTFQQSITALNGSCVEIPCTLDYQYDYREFNIIWYLFHFIDFPEIFNKNQPSKVISKYKNRTHLVGKQVNNCTLRIDHVEKPERYYPGISKQINSWYCNKKNLVSVNIKGTPDKPLLHVPGKNLTEGIPATISCSVKHTCPSKPPSLKWNMHGQTNVQHKIHKGYWEAVSKLSFYPSYKNNNTPLKCTAVYPTGQETRTVHNLEIKYSPKNTSISVIENKNINEGDNVKLMCNSQANPKVNNYTWYKVGNITDVKLQDHNNIITLKNVSRDNNKYYCSAMNELGKGDSKIIELPVESSSKKNMYIFVTSGIICLLLLLLLGLFFYWRKKKHFAQHSNKTINMKGVKSMDATYTELLHRGTANEYDELKVFAQFYLFLLHQTG
ncbi:myelin-associated glycoprotein-like [Bombina bombina]|uniref:myelin-associated glycoprotein-like n=1 Tax=Bombina bombina TaxID=8345 RepID=UPI00235AB3C9|nr:myelin-associated glycoprotein-like [Bombina bombina]